jgi:RHS repeat-associated protein
VEAAGLSYFGARWYDPALGRFMGVDPVGFSEANLHSFNRYAYANNNPYKFVDPDGRNPLSVLLIEVARWAGAGYALGVAADAASQYAAWGGVDLSLAATSSAAMAGLPAGAMAGLGFGAERAISSSAEAAVAARSAASAANVANKVNHIFREGKNLEGLVRASGGSAEAGYGAVQNAANEALRSGLLTPGANGVLPGAGAGAVLTVNGVNVQLIGGRVIDGVVKLGSFVGL